MKTSWKHVALVTTLSMGATLSACSGDRPDETTDDVDDYCASVDDADEICANPERASKESSGATPAAKPAGEPTGNTLETRHQPFVRP